MSNFTYEYDNLKERYETFEWDNTWIDHANDDTTARVLYIGDSISCGTRKIATKCAQTILFDGFGTSKSLDNPFLKDSVKLFAAQLPKTDALLLNNGLHGWHLNDTEEYPRYYEEMIRFLLEHFKGTPLLLVLTTHIRDEAREQRVILRNQAVLQLAQKYSLPVVDLYTVTKEHRALLAADGVHFTPEGYEIIAQTVADHVKKVINK